MKLNKLSVVILALALSACSVFPPPKTVRIYQLPASTVALSVPSKSLSLYIAQPYASRFLDHNRLAVILDTNEVQSYAGIRWEDTLPTMYKDRLVEDFRRVHAYQSVMSSDDKVTVDRILKLEIQDYQLQYKGKKIYVVVNVDATLVNSTDLSILGSANFKQESEVPSADLRSVMPVFAKITSAINSDIIRWSVAK